MEGARSKSAGKMVLRLYVAGDTLKSRMTIANLKDICNNELNGNCDVEVVDLAKRPDLAIENNISALPTLIKEVPQPVRTLIGDLVSKEKVLVALDIKKVGQEDNGHHGAKNTLTDLAELLRENARLKAENAQLRRLLRKNND